MAVFGDGSPFGTILIATMHNNTKLLRIEKFKYPLIYLTGSTKRAVEGIPLAEQNYDFAVKILTNHFGRQDLLVNENVDHVLALSPVKSSSDGLRVRLLHDSVQFHISALKA